MSSRPSILNTLDSNDERNRSKDRAVPTFCIWLFVYQEILFFKSRENLNITKLRGNPNIANYCI